MVEGAFAHYREDPGITRVEWKTRAHDRAPALHDALVRNGFVPGEPESIMIGEAALLAVDVPLPRESTGGSRASRTSARSVRCRKRSSGRVRLQEMADALLRRLGFGDGMELAAEADGEIVSSGRLEPVPGTEFAGIWGGATRPEWRGRRLYRALTAASCTISACAWQEADPQRLDRRIAPDPRTSGTSQGLDHDALPVGRRRQAGRATRPLRRMGERTVVMRQSG